MINLNIKLKDPSRETTTLYFQLWLLGERLRYYPGFRVNPSEWDGKKQRHKKDQNLNIQLNVLENRIREVISQAKIENRILTNNELADILKQKPGLGASEFWKLNEEYFKVKTPILASRTITKHKTCYWKISEFEKETGYRISLQSINMAFADRFMAWMYSKNHLNGYIDAVFNSLKAFLNWCVKEGAAVNMAYKDLPCLDEEGSPVFLFEDELEGLSQFDFHRKLLSEVENPMVHSFINNAENYLHALSNLGVRVKLDDHEAQVAYTELRRVLAKAEKLTRVRNRFVLACSTGLRVSDLNRIDKSLISEDVIIIPSIVKTRVKHIRIPLNRFSRRVINNVKHISDQKYNDYLKEMGEVAGLTRPNVVVKYSGPKKHEHHKPLYDFLTSHVARSTFITLSMMKGVSDDAIMAVTGIKKATTLRRYKKVVDQFITREMGKWG